MARIPLTACLRWERALKRGPSDDGLEYAKGARGSTLTSTARELDPVDDRILDGCCTLGVFRLEPRGRSFGIFYDHL